MANTGRKIYQFLKQVDAGTMIPTGVRKANVLGDPDYQSPVIDYATCPVVSWEAIVPFCITQQACEEGWTLNSTGTVCEKIETTSATPPSGNGGSPGTVAKVNNDQWNNGGARIYAPGFDVNGNGTVAASLLTPHLWVNGDAPWSSTTRNTVDSRMNAAGIWSVESTPDGEYIGFSRRITVSSPKTIYVGGSGDNVFKIVLNGVIVVDCQLIDGGPNFNFWNIYPISLNPGDNYVEVYGMNLGSVAGFGIEMYDMTIDELIAATTEADLNILFTTATLVGEPFDLGQTIGWSCVAGWSLDVTGSTPVCKRINSTSPSSVNTGMKGYSQRRRYNAGIIDGYVEDNTETGGLGPYFAPVSDTISCPLPPLPPPPAPTISQISDVNNGDGTRTQVFSLGSSVNVGNRFRVIVYSHVVEVIAVSGDTADSIAVKIKDAVNSTTPIEWNEFGQAPFGLVPGYPPAGISTLGNQVTLLLNLADTFTSAAYVI